MRFISFGDGYLNVDRISSIHTERSSASIKCVVTMDNGKRFVEQSSRDLSRVVLDKIVEKNCGVKAR